MTVAELFDVKYREAMKEMTGSCWEDIKYQAEFRKMHPAHWLYLCLDFKEKEAVKYGVSFEEIKKMHQQKMLKSNKHLDDKTPTFYMLTERGFKYINRNNDIC